VSELEINQTHITEAETMIFYASIFNLFFHFQIFFIAKGFWNFSDRWFSITAISEFAVVVVVVWQRGRWSYRG
jgi:hypothetical protein